mgnify:CR=1 FL=1
MDFKERQERFAKGLFPLASLQFELTSCCNGKCKHCYNNSGNNAVSDRMTINNWLFFSKYLVKHGGVYEYILSGGEPFLLGDGLFKIMNVLNASDTCFMLLTNGYFLNEEKVQILKKYKYHWLQISIDGVNAEYHDSFRMIKDGWKHAVNGARLVSKHGIPLKIAHCVTPYNINDIDAMCDLAYNIGAKEIIVGMLCYSGRTSLNKDYLLSKKQTDILWNKVLKNQEKYKGRMRVKSSNSIKEGLIKHMKKPYSAAVIRPNGDIRLDGMAPFVVGNVLEDDFASVWQHRIFESWTDSRVLEYINSFDEMDRNLNFVNYYNKDIYI